MRELSQKDICRFVFLGSKSLARSIRNPDSPFFNFCIEMRLSCLERSQAEKLVTDPFYQMGITLEDQSQLLARLIEISAGHPKYTPVHL